MEGVPQCYNEIKKPSAYRVKKRMYIVVNIAFLVFKTSCVTL